MHQLVNKDFGSIKMHGTTVKKKESNLFYYINWNFPFDTIIFGPGIVPVLPHMRWLSGTVSQGKMSSERLLRRAIFNP